MDPTIKALIELLDDLTPMQTRRLVYYCLEVPVEDIARKEGITRQAVHDMFYNIRKKIDHQEKMAVIQALCSKGFFINEP